MKLLSSLFFLLGALFFSIVNAADFANMSSLLSRGIDFDGKEIIVTGYVCKNSDSKNGLFLTMQDCEYSNYENAIRLLVDGSKIKKTGLVRLKGIYRRNLDIIRTDDPYRWGELVVLQVY